MKKIIKLKESDIESLVKKIIREQRLNELNAGDFEYIKKINICDLENNYSVGVGKRGSNELLLIINKNDEVIAHGPSMDFFKEGPSREKAICRMAESIIEDLGNVEESYTLEEESKGLWHNIRAKRERGEAPARKGSEAYKKAVKAAKEINAKTDHMDDHETNTYMFWQNLQTIKHAVEEMLSMDREDIDELLSDGHGWALDHIATSADDIEEVYHFLEGNDYDGDMEDEYEAYHESVKGKIIHQDEFGFTELLPMNEDGGKGACANRALNKPWLTPDGPKKRSVCVKNGEGNVVKVNFGDPNMRIKKSNPERRKSFRARHKCSEKKDRTSAGYWSCKFW